MNRLSAYVAIATLIAVTPAAAQTPADPATAPAATPAVAVIAPNPSGDIVANLKAAGQFTILLKAMDATNLTALLQKPGAFTLFAPTDAAFSALPAGVLDDLMKPANANKLQQIIAYHVVNTKITADQVAGHAATPVPSVINKPITIDGSSAPIKVNDATVIQAAAPASNGVIYVIDKVLTAP